MNTANWNPYCVKQDGQFVHETLRTTYDASVEAYEKLTGKTWKQLCKETDCRCLPVNLSSAG